MGVANAGARWQIAELGWEINNIKAVETELQVIFF